MNNMLIFKILIHFLFISWLLKHGLFSQIMPDFNATS